MTTTLIITIAIVAIIIGSYFGARKGEGMNQEQTKQKDERKEKILNFLNTKKQITNQDIQNLLKVSDATAERYLDEIEKEGTIKQVGNTGQSVHYTLK